MAIHRGSNVITKLIYSLQFADTSRDFALHAWNYVSPMIQRCFDTITCTLECLNRCYIDNVIHLVSGRGTIIDQRLDTYIEAYPIFPLSLRVLYLYLNIL